MEHFTKQMKLAHKVVKQLQNIIHQSIEYEEPYTSQQHIQDLIDGLEMMCQQAYHYVDEEKETPWRKKLQERDILIQELKADIAEYKKKESITFADIEAAKKKLESTDREAEEVLFEALKRYEVVQDCLGIMDNLKEKK